MHREIASTIRSRPFACVTCLVWLSLLGACGDGSDEGICSAPVGTYQVSASLRDVTSTDVRYDCDAPVPFAQQTSIFDGMGDPDVPGCTTTSVWAQDGRCQLIQITTCTDGSSDQLSINITPDGFSGVRVTVEDGCRVESDVSAVRLDN